MTIREIAHDLPWGFHDAYLERLEVDWTRDIAIVDLRVMVSERQDLDQRCRLSISGLVYISIDPPSPGSAVGSSDGDGLWIDSQESLASTDATNAPHLPSGCFVHRFFAYSTNAFINICARGVAFSWLEDSPVPARARTRALFPGDEV